MQKRKEEMKDEMHKQIDQMKKEVQDQMADTCRSLDNDVTSLKENLNLLSSMKQSAEDKADNSDYSHCDLLDTIETVKDTVNQSLSGEG